MQYVVKWILLLALFAPVLYYAFRQKKWYLYLPVAFVAILPEQLSISLHDKLPLISASRVLIVITAVFWFYQRIKTRNFKFPISMLVFLGISLLIAVFHLFSDTDEINRIFLIIMERGLVVAILVDMISTREEFDRSIDFLIAGCTILAVIAVLQTVFDYDIASVLHFTETVTSAKISNRMGLVRAYATKNAITYGAYSAFMVLPIYYRLQSTGKQRYSVAFALNFVALFATFTRSAWLCVLGVGALVFLTRPWKMIRCLWPSMVLVVVLCLGFSLIQPKFGAALSETAKSSVNTVMKVLPAEWFNNSEPKPTIPQDTTPDATGATQLTQPTVEVTGPTTTEPMTTEPTTTEPTTTEPAPTEPKPTEPSEPKPTTPGFELSDDFGYNANNPAYSRLFQWSAVKHMAENDHLLLGYGYNAFLQGQIYLIHKNWGTAYRVAPVLDVGFVSVFAESGLIGMLSYVFLLGYMVIQSLRKMNRKGGFDFYKMTIFSVVMYLLLNVLSAFVNVAVVWLFFGLFYAYDGLEKKGALAETQDIPEKSQKKWLF